MRDWRVAAGHDCQPGLQVLDLPVLVLHHAPQTADLLELVRHDSLEPGVGVPGVLLVAELLGEVQDAGGPRGDGRAVDLVQVQVEADRVHAPVCPLSLNSLELCQICLPSPLFRQGAL